MPGVVLHHQKFTVSLGAVPLGDAGEQPKVGGWTSCGLRVGQQS